VFKLIKYVNISEHALTEGHSPKERGESLSKSRHEILRQDLNAEALSEDAEDAEFYTKGPAEDTTRNLTKKANARSVSGLYFPVPRRDHPLRFV
jgi:hypothetical protein